MSRGPNKTITLVLGGARSGKSRYAQTLASGFKKVTFMATARPSDAEMGRKIAEHRRQRPASWKTAEAPETLDDALRKEGTEANALVVDCLTTYLANVMHRKNRGSSRVRNHISRICEAIQATEASIIIVSNEVGSGVVPAFQSGRLFRDLLGELNQQVAAIADKVVLMVAGVPLVVKDGAGF